jgi:RHS repeat-associated protein
VLTRRDGTAYEFAGHSGGPLLAIRDARGNQLTIERQWSPPIPGSNVSASRWPLRIISPNGRIVEFTVNTAVVGEELITQARDVATGRTVTYAYDASKRLISVTDPAGGITAYTYDGTSQRIATITDARGIGWLTNTYDASGRVTLQTFADSTTWQYAYTVDGGGKVTQADVTDPRGNVERLTFNSAGHVLTSTRAYGTALAQTTTYTRDATTHLPTRITDALGRNTDFTYDSQGNPLTVTRLAGTGSAVTTTYTYTATLSRVASITDPLSHATTFGYDSVGNLTSVTNALSQATTFTYDAQGQVVTARDALNQMTTFGYVQGDLASITSPLGETTTRFTDAAGRVLAVTDAVGRRTRYAWDNLNRLTTITDALGGQTQFSYDGNGNLLSLTDARSNTTSYTYSTMDRVATRTDPLTRTESYGYDTAGNLTSHTDRKSQVTGRTYDVLDRLTQVTYADSSTTTYTWDAANRVTQIVDSLSGTITRSYDGLDRLTQEETPQGTVSYTYDAAGRRTSLTVQGQGAITYGYDTADRLTQITQGSMTVTIGYDAAGRRTSLTLPNGVVTEYSYDAASRVVGQTFKNGAAVLGTLTYGYDASGSRVSTGGTWARTGLPSAVASATYNAANQQTVFAGATQVFDLNGNLTNDGTTTYAWDARNRLANLSGPSVTAAFAYDALGRRQSKTINGAQTRFQYDGLTPVQEQDGSGGVIANLLTGEGIDEYLARTDAGGTRSHLTDLLGSAVAELDGSANPQAEYTYAPFGQTAVSGSSSNAFRYTGREEDGTDLYYYRARYYHPGLQRFISEDPIGFRGGDWNLYAYVRSNPLRYRDPLGLCVTDDPADCFPPPSGPPDSPVPTSGRKDAPPPCDDPPSVHLGPNPVRLVAATPTEKAACIGLYVLCVTRRWQGECASCLHYCIAQDGEWPFSRCRPRGGRR